MDRADHPAFPVRKALPHEVPSWIDPAEETYFLTINARERGTNTLCQPAAGRALPESAAYRHAAGHWFIHLFLLMPDHLHALLSFAARDVEIRATVKAWKSWTARRVGVAWQRGWFEHRLRHDESASEKSAYILANPVRAGLVSAEYEWPWVLWSDARGGPLLQGWDANAHPYGG